MIAPLMEMFPVTCARLGVVYQGEFYGALQFTDRVPFSAAYGATFYVASPCTPASIEAALIAKRLEFAAATQLSGFSSQVSPRSWGDPQGGDSGHDYQSFR
ncbi:MAG: hypothetical protein ABIT76_08745 [Chthoniobacterales bacterium]